MLMLITLYEAVWDCNKGGDEILEDILMFNLCLLNQGNRPTFITRNRSEVIDIAVCNTKCITYIKDLLCCKQQTFQNLDDNSFFFVHNSLK